MRWRFPADIPNLLDGDDPDRVASSYWCNTERLMRAKWHYDPDNVFWPPFRCRSSTTTGAIWNMSISDLETTPREVNVGELLDVFGPRVQHITALSHAKGYCLLRSPFPLALFFSGEAR
jgi:Berberine and berberine like